MRSANHKSTSNESISIDELAEGQLPENVLKAIGQMKLTVEDLIRWNKSKTKFHVAIDDDKIHININTSLPSKKIITTIGSLAAVIWTVAEFLVPHIPDILSWF